MGLDVGTIEIKFLPRPSGIAYEFAMEVAVETSGDSYMWGEGNGWAPFTQRQVLRLLDQFAAAHSLADTDREEALAWVRSLPWEGWRDDLRIGKRRRSSDRHPIMDHHWTDGGLIELYFNW